MRKSSICSKFMRNNTENETMRSGRIKRFVSKNMLLLTFFILGCCIIFYINYQISSSQFGEIPEHEQTEITNQINSLRKEADSLASTQNYIDANQLYDQAIKLNHQDTLKEIELLQKKGENCERSDDLEEAIYSYLKILELGKDLDPNLALIRKKLGTIYSVNGFNQGLIDLYMPVLKDPNLKDEHVNAVIFIMGAYLNLNDLDSTMRFIQKGEKIIEPAMTRERSNLLMVKANYYLQTGKYSKAEPFLDSIETITGYTKDTMGLSQLHFTKATLAYMKDDWSKITDELKKSALFLEISNQGDNLVSAYFNIAGAYGALGDIKEENKYYRKAVDLKDSLKMLQPKKSIRDYVSNFKLKTESEAVHNLAEEQQQLTQAIENKTRQTLMLIVILFLLIVILFYGYRLFRSKEFQHKLKEKVLDNDKELLNKELEITKNRIEYDSKLITEKQQIIAALQEKIRSFTSDSEEHKELLSIVESFQEGLEQEKDNIEINILLNKENSTFLKHLKQKHPDITQTEVRYCTLLYLGFSTNEIARVLNISLDGVRKGRHRLRKKLGLEEAGDVSEYLHGI